MGVSKQYTKLLDTFCLFLKQKGKRFTPEREALLLAVFSLKGHFSPEDLIKQLHKQDNTMSVVTMYRNLPIFVEANILERTCLSSKHTRYEMIWAKEHHDHLICTDCGTITEFNYEAIEILQEALAAQYCFNIERHHLELLGTCHTCQQRV